MRKSIRKILKEQLENEDKVDKLFYILDNIHAGIDHLNETWEFDDASTELEEYFEAGGVTGNLRGAQQHLNDIFSKMSNIEKVATQAANAIGDEIQKLDPNAFDDDAPVGNDGMDEYLRGGGAMGGL